MSRKKPRHRALGLALGLSLAMTAHAKVPECEPAPEDQTILIAPCAAPSASSSSRDESPMRKPCPWTPGSCNEAF